jgi:hypothetical protein
MLFAALFQLCGLSLTVPPSLLAIADEVIA